MQIIPLQALPSQSFTIQLDGNEWVIEVKLAEGIVACSFTLNGNPVIIGNRAVAGYRLIPYDYLQAGNFAFVTTSFQIPDYTQFGTTQNLVYISQSEIDAIPAPFSGSQITAADFDPNGALPLRFQTQGYELA